MISQSATEKIMFSSSFSSRNSVRDLKSVHIDMPPLKNLMAGLYLQATGNRILTGIFQSQ